MSDSIKRVNAGVPEGGRFAALSRAESDAALNAAATTSSEQPDTSPWGDVTWAREVAPGIWETSTGGGGGWKVSEARNQLIDEEWRNPNGWYHEDVEAPIVQYTFRDELALDEDTNRFVVTLLKNQHPDSWESVTGERLFEGESIVRDQERYRIDHRNEYVGQGAATKRHDGQVVIRAYVDATGHFDDFIVPEEEYVKSHRFGIVIDPEKYMRTSPAAEKALGDQQKILNRIHPDTGATLAPNEGATRLEQAVTEYRDEMRYLNPGKYGNPKFADLGHWTPKMLMDDKTRRAVAEVALS